MQTLPVILVQKFAKTPSWQSNSKNRLLISHYCQIHFVSKKCRKSWELNLKETRKNGKGRKRNEKGLSRNESAAESETPVWIGTPGHQVLPRERKTEVCHLSMVPITDIALVLGRPPRDLRGSIAIHLEGGVLNLIVPAGAGAQEGTETMITAGTALALRALTVIIIDVRMIGQVKTAVPLCAMTVANVRAVRVGEREARPQNDLATLLPFRTTMTLGILKTNLIVLFALQPCNQMPHPCPRIENNDFKHCWRKRRLRWMLINMPERSRRACLLSSVKNRSAFLVVLVA